MHYKPTEIIASKGDPYSDNWYFISLEDLANIIGKGCNIEMHDKITLARRALREYGEPLPIGYTTPNGYTVENIFLPFEYSEKVWHYTFVKGRLEHTHTNQKAISLQWNSSAH